MEDGRVKPLDEKTLAEYLERAYRAESLFFPEDNTQTGSGQVYDAVLSVGNAVRALVAYVRAVQK